MKDLITILLCLVVLCSCHSKPKYNKNKSNQKKYNTVKKDKKTSKKTNKSSNKKPLIKQEDNIFFEENRAKKDAEKDSGEDREENINSSLDSRLFYTKNSKYKIGNPYKIGNDYYEPQEYDSLQESGIASWYGGEFHNKATANGEIYNKGDLTAAHRTLPLPSLVKVTNLRNNKSIVVRVNDRGPFSNKRIIDVSESVAEKLGFKNQGTTNVKIELLKKESNRLKYLLTK
jgi:rare lipoprotein A (peptidoglycan hydrolase)